LFLGSLRVPSLSLNRSAFKLTFEIDFYFLFSQGKKISGFNGVKNAVRDALEEGLTRILTPKQSMDILRDAKRANAEGRPYVVVFVGVNGVGKSTSLSKVCFWLKSQKLRVMLAACDTFRSGAVEQLKTHAARLDVPVFEKGYNKDAAAIAMDAVKHASQEGYDVVLVDTAGRMQDNEPLMRSLSKLVNLNQPDLVLFVGEALVGNDSIDQVASLPPPPREIRHPSCLSSISYSALLSLPAHGCLRVLTVVSRRIFSLRGVHARIPDSSMARDAAAAAAAARAQVTKFQQALKETAYGAPRAAPAAAPAELALRGVGALRGAGR